MMKKLKNCLVVLSVFLFGFTSSAIAFDESVLNSVVSIIADDQSSQTDPEGSAVALFPQGYFITNAHVVGQATKARLRLIDGRLLPARIVAVDKSTDLALLKTEFNFPVLPINTSPRLGERVCVVGNPFGLGLSVSCGVVSALRRTGTGFNSIEDFIQTDADINPGASGGALIDDKGQLVGLAASLFSESEDISIGVNFAISAELVLRVAEDLMKYGEVNRVKSGLRVRSLTDEEHLKEFGVRVSQVIKDSIAEAAGMREGDLITSIRDRPIHQATDLSTAFLLAKSGEKVAVRFYRNGTLFETHLQF